MIILEGPDGTGKTNLSHRLSQDLGLPLHERASTSVGGPVPNLWDWVCLDLATWDHQDLAIYDRHPLISEYIYGPIIRGRLPEGFDHISAQNMLKKFAARSLVVFCLPPLDNVVENVQNDEFPQMAGVRGNTEALYYSYAGRRASWPGWAIDYNYVERNGQGKGSYAAVSRAARLHIASWKDVLR